MPSCSRYVRYLLGSNRENIDLLVAHQALGRVIHSRSVCSVSTIMWKPITAVSTMTIMKTAAASSGLGRCAPMFARVLGCLTCTFALSIACGDASGPHAGPNILSGSNLSDTVTSIFSPPLVVQLLDGNKQPMSGQTVYFNTNAFVLVAPVGDPGFVIDRLPVTTD